MFDVELEIIGQVDISHTSPANITFSGDGPDVNFFWANGKFDVIYDANKLTEAAKVFCEAIGPYLNDYIEEKAKEI